MVEERWIVVSYEKFDIFFVASVVEWVILCKNVRRLMMMVKRSKNMGFSLGIHRVVEA